MDPVTDADSPDSARHHAVRLAAWVRLITLQRRFAAQFAAQDQADRIADRVLVAGLVLLGLPFAVALLALN